MDEKCPNCGALHTHRVTVYLRRCRHCLLRFDIRKITREPGQRTFYVFNHQGKADKMIETLTRFGYIEHPYQNNFRNVDLILSDYAAFGRQKQLERMQNLGASKFFIYPHAARPNLISDLEPEWEGVTAHFVSAPGHVEIMRSYGYDKPLHVIGWMLCPILPFKPRREARNILFAPIHPRCADSDKRINQATFTILASLARADKIRLTVRHINDLIDSGLSMVSHPNIYYVQGQMDNGYDQLDQADVVVGHQTIAYIAVARGVPTLMMGERQLPTHYMRARRVQYVRNWEKYIDMLAYPFDILETRDPLRLMERATRSDYGIRDWKKRMIGEEFCADQFMQILESYLNA